jgi:valyl-tRNA synthetase
MVKLLDKKDQLLAMGREMEWFPAFMEQRYEDWVTNLKWDWPISRQRPFGVPIPFWYSKRPGEEGRILTPHPDDLPVNPLSTPPRGYTMDEVEPDPDVLDTWATSSVSPQINAHGISPEHAVDPDRFGKLFPADMRPQAHEIIRTWAFYTVVKSMLHSGRPPFATLAISGFCLARDKTKMSKSKGNGIEPKDLLDQYGTDIVRYWSASSRLGHDTAFSDDVLKIGKRLVNKLRNAAKFVAPHIAAFDGQEPTFAVNDVADKRIHCTLDLWLLSRLSKVIAAATNRFHANDYTDALEAIERFFFGEFCDNYLELVKGRIYGETGSEADKLSAQQTLGHALLAILHLFAPFMPYAAEDILHETFPRIAAKLVSVHRRGGWPQADRYGIDETALRAGELTVEILGRVRAAKSEKGVSIKAPLGRIVIDRPGAGDLLTPDLRRDLQHTASAEALIVTEETGNEAITLDWPVAVDN